MPLQLSSLKKKLMSLIIEDEGKNIGMIHLPDSLKNKALQSSIVILTATLEERLDISLKTYVIDMAENFCLISNISGFNNYSDYWKNSLFKIQKRLGGLRYKSLLNQLNLALKSHKENNDLKNYRPLIESLLVDYYDPMYDYQISKKKQRIVFQGNSQDVLAYLDCN